MDKFNLCICGPAVFLSCHFLPGYRGIGTRKGPEVAHWELLGSVPSCRCHDLSRFTGWWRKNGVTAFGSWWPSMTTWSHSSVSVCQSQRFLPKICWNRRFVIPLQHNDSVTLGLNLTRVYIPFLNDFQSHYLLLYLALISSARVKNIYGFHAVHLSH